MNELAPTQKPRFSTKGDLIVRMEGDTAVAKCGVLFTIGDKDGMEVSYKDYQRIRKTILETDAKFIELGNGAIIATNQITRLYERTKTLVARRNGQNSIDTQLDDKNATDELSEAQKAQIIERLRAKFGWRKK